MCSATAPKADIGSFDHLVSPPPSLALLEKGVEKRIGSLVMTGELTMSGKATAFVAGVLLASMFWIVLAQQSYCAGSVADWPCTWAT
jgi:hypothetical protein